MDRSNDLAGQRGKSGQLWRVKLTIRLSQLVCVHQQFSKKILLWRHLLKPPPMN